MKRFKFQTRLILGFSIILIFSFIIGAISFIELRNIRSHTEAIYQHPLAVSNSVRDINISINAIHRSMKDIVLAKNDEQLYESILIVDKYDHQIYESFKIVENRFLGDQEIVNDTYQAYKDWEKIRNEVILLKKGGHDDRAADITTGRGAFHVNQLFEKTKLLTDFAQNKADEFYQNTLSAEHKGIIMLTISISLLLLLSAITAFFISRSISKPIHKFIKEIASILRKNNDIDENILGKSEQEILAASSKKLQLAYQNLDEFNKELDRKIELRTAELKEAKEKAEESEQLKTAFLANMSHEIRTPLNSVLGFSEFLRSDSLPKKKKEIYLDMINAGGQRLLTIISDIVDISKIEAGQFSLNYEICNLNKLIEDLKNQFSIANSNKEIEIISDKALENTSSYISTDTTRLTQVISNLIENALKFTDFGKITIGYHIKNKQLVFFVSDTGIGIPKKYQQIIFERFRQTDLQNSNLPTGTGLGLAIAKGIIDLFGGNIWVESEEDKGSKFYFTIPYLPALSNEKFSPKDDNELILKAGGKTILIVEDELSNYIYLKDLLHMHHFNVLHAKNGKDAVELIHRGVLIDLILMDIRMPVMNGFQATREIRKTNKTVPVIAQTAYAMSEDKRKAIEAGCNDYIAKPITTRVFTQIVQKHLN